jgi:dihydrofolate reductase
MCGIRAGTLPGLPGTIQEKAMRELTVDMFVSLDGFAAGDDGGQSWTFGYFGPEFAVYAQRVLAEPQIMLMGRVTYQIMARSWPFSPGPLAGPMNSLPKLVFSATLAEPLTWHNAHLAKSAPAEEIRALKKQPGDPLRTIGNITLVRHLMAAGLVDRLRLVVFPRVLGQVGQEPVFASYPETSLDLTSTTVLDSRLVVCEYRPKTPA